jgi:hypothetical protein
MSVRPTWRAKAQLNYCAMQQYPHAISAFLRLHNI